ncbi:MAG: hypothetical protein GY789_22890 [Hyphomicrobiales bacterium]|nr:hypothetical protein [Hyphomicrobiales bacterium]
MKNRIGVLYALLFTIALAFIAYIDGLLFRIVYPDDPAWQSTVGFGLLSALSGVGFVVAGRSAVSDGRETRISLTISSLALLSLGGFIASLYSPGTYVALIAYILLALMLLASFIASIGWRKRDGNIQLGALWITGLATSAVVAVVVFSTFGLARETILLPNAIKAIYSILLLAVMTSLTAHVIHLRWRHAMAVEAQIAALEGEAKRSQELLVAEKNYSSANANWQRHRMT